MKNSITAEKELKEIVKELDNKFNYSNFRIVEETIGDKIRLSLTCNDGTKFFVDVTGTSNKKATAKEIYIGRQEGYTVLMGMIAQNYLQNNLINHLSKNP